MTTCSGALLDSGGQGAAGYGNNENVAITICPGQAGNAISLSFITFTLSTAGSVPGDRLSIYDGNSTGAPLLGTWSGNQSPNVVSASFGNVSGCLTVVFTSNEVGTGVFAASILCHVPCDPPVAAAAMSESAPALICRGETVVFDASASTAANGQPITQYLWNFADGTIDSTSGALVSHAFTGEPGENVVRLTVTDDQGCTSTAPVELQVLVSTPPTFHGLEDQTHCVGESAVLNAAVQGTTWAGQQQVSFGDGLYLPDALGESFTTSINFTKYPPGATLENIDDLESVCIEMEHSWMGDLIIQLTSPSGTTVIFHQQGDEAQTYLGIPVDDDENDPQIGTCWEYCFSPGATNGTWADNAGQGTLPAGIYESVQPMSDFVGSPLNGVWTLTVFDLWGADNGFICGWSINLNPSLIPAPTVYTPVIGLTPDSCFWSGDYLTLDPGNPLGALATPTQTGTFPYTLTVVDNFGCTYDTTLNVTYTPALNFSVTSTPPSVCGNPIPLQTQIHPPVPAGAITFQWSPAAGLSNPSSAFPIASPTAPTWYALTAFPAGHPQCGMVDSLFLNPLTTLHLESAVVDHACHGDDLGYFAAVTTGTGGPWNYTWTDSNNNVVQTTNGAFGDTLFAGGGTYHVQVTEGPGGNQCSGNLTATIGEPPPILVTASADTSICVSGTAVLSAQVAGGNGPVELHWGQGLAGNGPHVVAPSVTTTYSVHATDGALCSSDTLFTTVLVRDSLSFTLDGTLAACPGTDVLLTPADVGGGDGQWTYDWGNGPSPEPSLNVVPDGPQTYCLTLRDGCETPPVQHCIAVEMAVNPPLEMTADTTLGCAPFLVHFTLADTTGGATVDWTFGNGPADHGQPVHAAHLFDQPGTYSVTVNVHWPNGCSTTATYTDLISVIAVPQADFSWSPNVISTSQPQVHFNELAGEDATAFEWDFAGIGSSHAANPTFTFPNAFGANYPVELIVRNQLGCADSMVHVLSVADEFGVFVPNSFTPDNDGVNDLLYVSGSAIAEAGFLFLVFDRWGEVIFESTKPEAGWDGTYQGELVQDGIYSWLLRVRSSNTKINHLLRGSVTILR